MRILLTGAAGQVGWELRRTLAPLGEVIATDRATLDLADEARTRAFVREVAPRWVVNAAAYTAVDAAEGDREAASWLNASVPRILAEEAERLGAWMVHYSTDYVFDGAATRPYREDDPTAPLGVYGATKLAGERGVAESVRRHLTFRIAWVYAARGKNFLRTVRRLARERDELRVVRDQVGVPTWARAVAEATALVIATRPTDAQAGLYHLAGGGTCSWHAFAEAILRGDPEPASLKARGVTPITTAEFPTPARRPAWSVLDAARAASAFGVRLPSWEEQLALCLDGMRA